MVVVLGLVILTLDKVDTPYHDNDLNLDSYNITTKWLAVNLKLPGTSHGQF
jgi:hypothetical protein